MKKTKKKPAIPNENIKEILDMIEMLLANSCEIKMTNGYANGVEFPKLGVLEEYTPPKMLIEIEYTPI